MRIKDASVGTIVEVCGRSGEIARSPDGRYKDEENSLIFISFDLSEGSPEWCPAEEIEFQEEAPYL
jgi:hypothetical protein